MKQTAIASVARVSSKNYYCAAPDDTYEYFTLIGYGETPEAAIKDFYTVLSEMTELEAEEGRTVPEVSFSFNYDVPSFFARFPYLNTTKIAEKAGINHSLLRLYKSGAKKAGSSITTRLFNALEDIKGELSNVSLSS